MRIALTILLIAFCVQGLVKFAVAFFVPYDSRMRKIASYCERNGRIISIYDTVTLIIMVALVTLLALVDMQHLSFITGLVVGMLTIQIYQLRKIIKNRGHFPSDDAAIKLLWLAIRDIEDKRARARAKEKGLPAIQRRAQGRLVEGAVVQGWKLALGSLAIAYPERVNPYLT